MRIALAAMAALMVGLAPAVAGDLSAHGDATEIFRATEGAYELVLAVQPEETVVGTTHITITPFDATISAPVDRAEIVIVAHNPDGAPTYQVRAVNTPASAEYYDANITFHEAGEWTLVVDVEQAGTGSATFNVPMTVRPQLIPPRGVVGTAVWLLICAALVGGVALVWYQSRRALGRRERTDG